MLVEATISLFSEIAGEEINAENPNRSAFGVVGKVSGELLVTVTAVFVGVMP